MMAKTSSKRRSQTGKSVWEVAEFYIDKFLEDYKALNLTMRYLGSVLLIIYPKTLSWSMRADCEKATPTKLAMVSYYDTLNSRNMLISRTRSR